MNAGPGGAIAIIPARLGSTRLPRKVLAAETGKPLIRHVCEAAGRATLVSRVVVATDAREVLDAVEGFGGEAVLTGEHPNGTSRLAEAARLLGLDDEAVVANVQGDEPELEAGVIDAAIQRLTSPDEVDIATVGSPMERGAAFADPNVVKLVIGASGRAVYFSRAPVPFDRDGEGAAPTLRHVGIYVYRVRTLRRYAALEETPLERAERLEQLRALEHGMSIGVAVRASDHVGIDTPEQYAAFVERWRAGPRG